MFQTNQLLLEKVPVCKKFLLSKIQVSCRKIPLVNRTPLKYPDNPLIITQIKRKLTFSVKGSLS